MQSRQLYRNILTGYMWPDMMSIPISVGGRMKVRNAQSDQRKNPDSPRVHGLRLAVSSSSESVRGIESSQEGAEASPPPRQCATEVFDLPLTDRRARAAVSKERDACHFLTVKEVAVRLCVSCNWVYSHADALGAYHLGKYLRFSWSRVLERLESLEK